MIGHVAQLPAVWGEGVADITAEREGRAVPPPRSQVLLHLAGGCVDQKDVSEPSLAPLVPVAVEQLIGHVSSQRAVSPGL